MKNERDLSGAFEEIFGEIFRLTDPIVDSEKEKKLYAEEEVKALLNEQKERLCTKPRTISVGSTISANNILGSMGFEKAGISDYYKSETNEVAHVEGDFTAATITITKL